MRFSPFVPMILAGLAVPASQATAGPVYDGPNGATFNYYGHLNFAYVSVDDGTENKNFVANNDNSTSRFGFNIRRPFGATEFRFNFETSLGFPSTSQYDNDPATDDPTFEWTKLNLRKVDFSLSGDTWGALSLGQGSMASDGSAEQDLSGVGLTTYIGIGDLAGGFIFRNSANSALSGINIGSVFNQFDGNSRRGRIRYDTPSFSGVVASASYGEEILATDSDQKFWDVALSYDNEFANGTEVIAKIAYYVQDKQGNETDGVTGSASMQLASGLNFTIASGSLGEPSYFYGKIGYTRQFWAVGSTAFGIDVFSGSDYALTGAATESTSESVGLGMAQKFDDYNLEAYLGYRFHAYDDNVADYDDIGAVILGARWKF